MVDRPEVPAIIPTTVLAMMRVAAMAVEMAVEMAVVEAVIDD